MSADKTPKSAAFQHETRFGGRMMRSLHSLRAIPLAVGLIGAPPLAQAQLSESPMTPGFWTFANRKSETTQDVRAACRNYIVFLPVSMPIVLTATALCLLRHGSMLLVL
jgi:disulfide bond formation protein DsbB